MKSQSGFTLVELVMVIVILGILAATALPKFVNLSGDAKKSAVQGVASALSSAGSINYAARSLGPNSVNYASTSATSGVSCDTIAGNLLQGGKPDGYSFTGNAPTCTVDANPAVSAVVVTIPEIN